MKKTLLVIVAVFTVLALLTGCGDSGASSKPSLKGSEAAKLLLAEERLNSQLLKNDGDIFENGSEVFRNLAATAKDNLVKYTYADSTNQITSLSLNNDDVILLASSVTESTDGSKLEIDGELYQWSDFAEYSNSYDYFTNLTGNVVWTAESAAQQIDDTKRFVRVIDKWVKIGETQYYLHVEDNCEILYERQGDFLKICKRTRDELGVNVYEIYNSSANSETRMTYIQGRKYEYTNRSRVGGYNQNFIAENTKGFWEVLDVGKTDTHYNVSCMVVKDDICYDAFYEPAFENRGLSLLKVISADKKTDIMHFTDGGRAVNLMLQGFDGIEKIQIIAPDDRVSENKGINLGYSVVYLEQDGERYYFMTGEESAEVVLENGMVLRSGDVYLDGKVSIGRSMVSFSNKEGGICGYAPTLDLHINGENYEECMQILNDFLVLTGIRCRRDMSYVHSGILQAYAELGEFVEHHVWNESKITTEEDLAVGFENLDAKYNYWSDLYDGVKDGEVIDINDSEIMALNVHFSPIAEQYAVAVKNEGRTVSIEGLNLTVEDTALFVENDSYMVNFALLGTSGLVHIDVQGTNSVKYDGAKPFSLSQSATFTLPLLTPGEYVVVAYISTLDGIRMSGYINLSFTEVSEFEEKNANILMKATTLGNGELVMICQQTDEAEVEVAFDKADVYYSDMYKALSEAAYQYGYTADDAKVEILSEDNAWVTLSGEETLIDAGTYRLKYEIKNADSLTEGYVFTHYVK